MQNAKLKTLVPQQKTSWVSKEVNEPRVRHEEVQGLGLRGEVDEYPTCTEIPALGSIKGGSFQHTATGHACVGR